MGLRTSIIIMLSLVAVVVAEASRLETALTPMAQEELNLRRDIQLLNLVDGLYLTQEQMQELIKVVTVARKLREEHQTRMQQYTAAARPVLEELRESLIAGRGKPDDLARRVHQSQAPIHKELQEHQKKMLLLVDDVRRILNENQIELLRDYKPCLIPPYNPSSASIGQSSVDPGPTVRMLERIRSLRPRAWNARKHRIIEQMAEHALFYGHVQLTAEDKGQLLQLMEQARALPDVQWEGQKTVLARKVRSLLERDSRPKGDLELARKIGQFMLNPRLAPILEGRLDKSRASEAQSAKQTTRLTSPPPQGARGR